MKKGQKSVIDGIENFLCPVTDMYVTQGANGSYSHKGTMAVDIRGLKAGVQSPYYAPCTVKCLKTYPSSGQAMWQSVNNVRCADGYIGKVTFMTCHDNTMNASSGLVIPQGNQLGNMGTKGNATGVHVHFQGAETSDTTWIKNKYGIYYFPNNEKDIDELCFMDNTNIMNCPTLNKVYTSSLTKQQATETQKKDDTESKIANLNKTITELQNEAEDLKKQLNNANDELSKCKIELNDVPNVEFIFESPKLDYYAIKLNKNKKLYIGK